jgi:hypothetical protein
MIKGHEDITHDLTEQEYELAVRLVPFLEKRTVDNPILAKQIIDGVNNKWNPKPKLTDSRFIEASSAEEAKKIFYDIIQQ